MASVQNFFVKRLVFLFRKNAELRKHIDNVQVMRKNSDRLLSKLPIPKGVRFKRFYIKHIPAAWLTPEVLPNPQKVVLYLHGGGYAVGSVQTHKAFASKIAQMAGANALIIDYRLAPENPFPAALEDAAEAYRYLLQQGFLPQNIVIAGDSAGGGLTLATLLFLKENELPLPAAAVCYSPWTDLAATGKSNITNTKTDPMLIAHKITEWGKNYAGTKSTQHPLVSPLYGNLKGLPPILIQVGTEELIMDDSIRFAKKAQEAGCNVTLEVWNDMIHVFPKFWRVLPEARQALNRTVQFIEQHTQHTNANEC